MLKVFSQKKRDNDTIAILNTIVRLKLKPSPIDGIGVFAIQDIPKDTKLYANIFPQAYRIPYKDFKRIKPKIADLIIERWPQVVNSGAFMYPDTFLQGYMNHSETPNYDAINDITLKEIYVGEEILEDYRKIPNYEKVYPWLIE